jgi:hypothetical protein
MKFSNKKLIISGNIFELYRYNGTILTSPLPQSKAPSKRIVNPPKTEREASSIYRSKKRLKRLVNANVGFHKDKKGKIIKPLFITLTFKENITNVNQANYEFTKFIQRFNYEVFDSHKSKMRYVVSIEFQERGAVHYHVLFFNLPFIERIYDKVSSIWGEGFIWIDLVKYNIQDVGNYMTKYMTKELSDPRLCRKKSYFSSRNLFKSLVIKDQEKVDFILNFLKPEQKTFEKKDCAPDYGPTYDYEVYNLEDSAFVASLLDLLVKPGYFEEKL